MRSAVDMHLHSTVSDGTDCPEELLQKVLDAGITIFTLSDHDEIAGCRKLQEALDQKRREGKVSEEVAFIPGVEFGCGSGLSSCHLLGFGYRLDAQPIGACVARGKELRQTKKERRFQFLKENFGITFSEEEIAWLQAQQSVGRPHFAQLLVKKGIAPDMDHAYLDYLNACNTKDLRQNTEDCIRAIEESGGIPIWAHPLGGKKDGHLSREKFEEKLEVLSAMGIRGFECYYSRYSQEEVAFLVETAEKRGFLISGGSDYHGKNKDVELGMLNRYGAVVQKEQLTLLKEFL